MSLGIWWVLLFSLWITVFGNPLYKMVSGMDPVFLQRAEQITSTERMPATEEEFLFFKRFSRMTMLEIAVFVLEIILLVSLWVQGILVALAISLLVKELVFVLITARVAMTFAADEDGIFKSMQALPSWVGWFDRLSAAITGAAFTFIFVYIHFYNS